MTTVRTEALRDGVRLVTLDRPETLNAMSPGLVGDLHDVLGEIGADGSCRAVILTGEGRGFCSGLDLSEPQVLEGTEDLGRVQAGMHVQQRIASLMVRLRELPQPTVAAVNGPATGGGLALALACDTRVAASSARFNAAFVRLGLSGCDVGVSYLLPRIVGPTLAFEMMLSGRLVDAEEAERRGLVLRVVGDGGVVDAALEVADGIVRNSPFGVWMTKEVMWANLEASSLRGAIDLENRTQILTSQTEDMREAMTAFVEKRDPEFRNR